MKLVGPAGHEAGRKGRIGDGICLVRRPMGGAWGGTHGESPIDLILYGEYPAPIMSLM